jgi:type IV pilus assembly protein PilB
MTQRPGPAKRLGEMLIEKKLLSRLQLEEALAIQQRTGQYLGAILIELKIITRETLLQTVAEQFGITFEAIDLSKVNWALLKQFPASLLEEGRCFPLRGTESSITVAISNPLDAIALSELNRTAGMRRVDLVLVKEEELRAAVKAYRQRHLLDITQRLGAE